MSSKGTEAESAEYVELGEIGTGAYATVLKARDRNDPNSIVALKRLLISLTEDGIPNTTIREIAILKRLCFFDHPNIVKLIDVCVGPKSAREQVLYLVFEHLEQDLGEYIYGLPPQTFLNPIVIQRMAREILTGISFLHSHRIVHRDIKPQNLLVSGEGLIKVADFGLAKTYDFEMKLTSLVVTLWYRAPEVLLNQPYTSAVDVWSVACILAELYEMRPLFPGTSEKNQLERIFELAGTPDIWPENASLAQDAFPVHTTKEPKDMCSNLCEYSNDLLDLMLAFAHNDRPTADECLRHPYFQQEFPADDKGK